jgi:hypothetical protein
MLERCWYAGIGQGFWVDVLGRASDEDGMVKVRRVDDGLVVWTYPFNLHERQPEEPA